jgi:cytochrome c oxidase cbb3-type subunit I/II
MGAMQTLGVPYTDVSESYAAAEMKRQGDEIVGRLATGGITARPGTEIIAVIAYLQRLGTDFRAPQTASR